MFYKKIKELITHSTFDSAPIKVYPEIIPYLDDVLDEINEMTNLLKLNDAVKFNRKVSDVTYQRVSSQEFKMTI